MRTRPIEPVDIPRVEVFLAALTDLLGSEAVGERKQVSLAARGGGWLAEEEGDIVGVAPFVEDDTGGTFELATQRTEVAERLVDCLLDGAGGEPLRAWSLRGRHGLVLERAGFTTERTLYQLGAFLPLEPVEVDGVTFRGFTAGDEARWVEVNNLAFAGHAEQGRLTVGDFRRLTQQGWWEPDGLRFMESDGTIVGSCWTKVHPGGLGEIYVIGIDPAFHGRGWGKALTIEGLRHLHDDRGCREAILYADAGNQAAMALYRGLGFEVRHTDSAYVLDQPKLR